VISLAAERIGSAEEARRVLLQVDIERTRSSLLSSVSHDMRTPLAGIEGTASLLAEQGARLPEKDRRQMADEIVEESRRMSRLVENLLSITRLESSAAERIAKQWQPLEETVGVAIAHAGPPAAGRLVTRIPERMVLAPVDAVLLEQALLNLIDNALKYSPSGSPVEIALSQSGDRAVIEVMDRGPGVPDEEKELVFEKFRRGSAARPAGDDTVGGSGLGLAICSAIALAHGGAVRVTDRPGGGSVFALEIPIEGEPPGVTEAEAEEDAT
jgi:two-component system sensor histidine kinase KdpD